MAYRMGNQKEKSCGLMSPQSGMGMQLGLQSHRGACLSPCHGLRKYVDDVCCPLDAPLRAGKQGQRQEVGRRLDGGRREILNGRASQEVVGLLLREQHR